MTDQLPSFGHPLSDRGFKVLQPIGRVGWVGHGRHLILGQRTGRGSLSNLIFLGKCIEHTGAPDYFDSNVWLDVSFPHAIFLSGARGSGKSFDIGVFVESLLLNPSSKVTTSNHPAAVLLLDPQNQFWTLGRPPDENLPEDEEHTAALKAWSLQPAAIGDVRVYVCPGDPTPIGTEVDFTLPASLLTADDLCSFWGTDVYSPQGHLISTVLEKVSQTGYDSAPAGASPDALPEHVSALSEFTLEDLVKCLQTDTEILRSTPTQTVDAVNWRLNSLRKLGIFVAKGIPFVDLLVNGRATVVSLRSVDDATKALVGGLLVKKVYELMGAHHSKRKVERRLHGATQAISGGLPEHVWCVVDEAHLFCPADHDTSSTRALIEYVKRGRDAGLSLLLATQQPSAVNSRLLSQVDTVLVHRLTFGGDIHAALDRIPAAIPESFMTGNTPKDARGLVRLLESGEAILGDAQADRAFLFRTRPRLTAHGGSEPKP